MSSTAASPPVEDIYGPYLFAALLATAFYSLMCMQTFRYFVLYQKDFLSLKALVAFVWTVNTVHEGLTISTAYKEIIGGLRNPRAFLVGHPEIFLKPFMTALVAVTVQGFFAHRIFICAALSGTSFSITPSRSLAVTKKNFIVPVLWFICAMLQIVCSILLYAKALYISNGTLKIVPNTDLSHYPYRLLETLIVVPAAVLDILIAIAMTILLAWEWKSPRLLPRTSRMLLRLIVFSVNTGTWTAVFAIISLVLVYASPTTVINTIVGTAVCSVYSNTLLANLNARDSFGDTQNVTQGTNTFRFSLSALPGVSSVGQPEDSTESSSTQKVDVHPSEDAWKSTKESASQNV